MPRVSADINSFLGAANKSAAIVALGASVGGNGVADAGKLVMYGADGSIRASASTQAFMGIPTSPGGIAMEGAVQNNGDRAFSTHFNGDNQVAFDIDGSGAGADCIGIAALMDGCLWKVESLANSDVPISAWSDGTLRFTTGGDASATNSLRVSGDTPTGQRDIKVPDKAGKLCVLPVYADLTAANVDLDVGDIWWDSTLNKARTATA